MKKIELEYTNTAEIEAKKEEALRQESNRYYNAYKPLELKFYQEFAKTKVEFHNVDVDGRIERRNSEYRFLSEYGPDGVLYKISNKKTKKYCIELSFVPNGWSIAGYISKEADEWYKAIIIEDKKKAENFLKRKTIKSILNEMCNVVSENADNRSNIIRHYNSMIEKAQQIQKIGAEYKDVYEFVNAIKEEAKKFGYYACMKNHSIEFHKDCGNNQYAHAITAYATLPYSRKKANDCIIFTHELFEQVMQPLHDALKIDNSWEDKYNGVFYFNKMKTKVKVHVADGDGCHWRAVAKEFSNTEFNEVNFKKWLKKAEISEYRHLTKEFLKKARSI